MMKNTLVFFEALKFPFNLNKKRRRESESLDEKKIGVG